MNVDQGPPSNTDPPQVDTRRRRFATGGLGASVIIGSLLSRPVLGQTPNCTQSAMVSGNVSLHGDQSACVAMGDSIQQWVQSTYDWPAYEPGSGMIDANGNPIAIPSGRGRRISTGQPEGSLFTVPGFQNVFKIVSDEPGKYRISSSPGDHGNATMLQILAAPPNGDPLLSLGQAAVATLLNSLRYSSKFPLTPQQVVSMFNATCYGGTYQVDSSTSWSATEVQAYFDLLNG